MTKETFTSIMALVKDTLTSNDYKQTFQLAKVKGTPGDRQILEWLKTGLKTFGMDLCIIKKNVRVNNKIAKEILYLIDLNEEIIDLLYRNTHGNIDILIDNITETNADIIYDF